MRSWIWWSDWRPESDDQIGGLNLTIRLKEWIWQYLDTRIIIRLTCWIWYLILQRNLLSIMWWGIAKNITSPWLLAQKSKLWLWTDLNGNVQLQTKNVQFWKFQSQSKSLPHYLWRHHTKFKWSSWLQFGMSKNLTKEIRSNFENSKSQHYL